MTSEDAARRFYGGPPPAPRADASIVARPRDPAQVLYGDDPVRPYRTIFRRYRDPLFDAGVTAAQLQREQAAFAQTAHELGVNLVDGERLYAMWSDARLKASRAPFTGEQVAAQMVTWGQQARQELRQKFDPELADTWLAKVDAFVKRVPGLDEILTDSALGTHPAIVGMLVEHITQHPETMDPDDAAAAAGADTTTD